MLLAEFREAGYHFRVWTQEDASYGSFKVVSREELLCIARAFHLMGGCCRQADHDASELPGTVKGDCPWCPVLVDAQGNLCP